MTKHWTERLQCSCGKTFRNMAQEACHRHNFPTMCKPKKVKAVRRNAMDYRHQGIACALAELAGGQREPDMAMFVMRALGVTVEELRACGADEHDLKILEEIKS